MKETAWIQLDEKKESISKAGEGKAEVGEDKKESRVEEAICLAKA